MVCHVLFLFQLCFVNTSLPPTGLSMITIVGLKPETTYEVKISAINGKGEGESSPPTSFKTEPVRKYSFSRSHPCSQLALTLL